MVLIFYRIEEDHNTNRNLTHSGADLYKVLHLSPKELEKICNFYETECLFVKNREFPITKLFEIVFILEE